MHARFPAPLLAALLLQACDQRIPMAPGEAAVTRQAGGQDEGTRRVVDRFDLQLSAHGPMRPGAPIRISARAAANIATPLARIELALPDVEVGWHVQAHGRRPWLGTPLPAAAEWEGSLGAGQAREAGTVITIPEPGYYRVVATAFTAPEADLAPSSGAGAGAVMRNAAVRELWLLVDDTRGAVHASRRLAELPSDVERVAGPFRRIEGRGPRAGGHFAPLLVAPEDVDTTAGGDPPTGAPATSSNPHGWLQGAPGSYGEIAVSVGYYHPLERTFRPAGGIPVFADVWRHEQGGDRWLGGYQANTSINGGNLFPCSPADPDEYMVFRADLSSGTVSMIGADPSSEVVATHRECGLEYFFLETDPPHTRVFLNLTRAADEGRRIFGASRPPIAVVIDGSPWATASRYSPGSSGGERLSIIAADVWDDYGTFVQAHEYGHAFHQRAWGGIVGSCPGTHQLDQPTSLGCAYSEGIADFYSFATLPHTWLARTFSGVTATYGTDRSTTEAYVASFLTRLIDSASDPARPWDLAQFPGRYVGETIRTCTTDGVSPARADGIDRLIYCLERTVDPIIRNAYFTSRANASRITTQQSAVAAPAGWHRSYVRSLWERVLYGQEWTYYP